MSSGSLNGAASQTEQSSGTTRRLVLYGTALLGVELLARDAHQRNNLPALTVLLLLSGMTFAVAVREVFRTPHERRSTLVCIVAFAFLFRGLLVPLDPPRLSTDVYRYVWDGRVQSAGINPYLYPPADPHLAFLRDSKVYPNINRKEYARTIYPPTAQLFFRLVTRVSGSVAGMKAAMTAADCGTVLILVVLLTYAGLPRKRVLVYAWHPLPVWEFAGTGHIDALMLLLTVSAFAALCGRRPGLAGATLAVAALTKFLPFALLPAFFQRHRWRWGLVVPVVAAALYLPYAVAAGSNVLGFLPQYSREEGLTGGDRFYLLRLTNAAASLIARRPVRFSPLAFLALALVAYVAVVIAFASVREWRSAVERAGATESRPGIVASAHRILAITVLISVLLSPDYPWYYAWVVPWLVFVPSAPALLLTLAVFVLYRSINEPSATDTFLFHSQLFLPVLAWMAYRFIDRRIHPAYLNHEF